MRVLEHVWRWKDNFPSSVDQAQAVRYLNSCNLSSSPSTAQRQSFSRQLLAVLELALTRTALNSGGCLWIQSAGIKSMSYHYHHHHWLIFLISKEYYKHQVSLWHFQIS